MGPHFVLASEDAKDYRVGGYRPMHLREAIDFCRMLNGGAGEVEIWAENEDEPREIWSPEGRRIHPAPPAPVAPPPPEPVPTWEPFIRWDRRAMRWVQVG